MEYFAEFPGGLGDLIIHSYQPGSRYMTVANLPAPHTITVAIWSENLYVREMFNWCPASRRIIAFSYRPHLAEDPHLRELLGLPEKAYHGQIPPADARPPIWYPSPSDLQTIESIPRPFVVVAPSATTQEKMFTQELLDLVCEELAANQITPVVVGRNFPAWDKERIELEPKSKGAVNLVDKLSCPGSLRLVELSSGCVVTESSILHASWKQHKPTLLLYGAKTQELHFDQDSGYAYGRNYLESICCRFETFCHSDFDRFVKLVNPA